MPSKVPLSCGKRLARNAASSGVLSSWTWRSTSFETSSTDILQPSCSPKKVRFVPTTGPRSSRCGWSRAPRLERKRASALVGWTGASAACTSESGSFLRRRENRSERATDISNQRRSGSGRARRARSGTSARRRLRRRRLGLLLRLRLGSGCRLALLGLLAALALHVHGAAEVGPLGDGHARRDDVAVDGAAVA